MKFKLISSVVLSFLLSATAFAGEDNKSLCNNGEKVVFSCELSEGKLVSFCASDLTKYDGTIQYRFGVKDDIELKLPEYSKHPNLIRSLSWKTIVSGDLESIALRINNGKYAYFVYENASKEESGIIVKSNKKIISTYQCTDYRRFDKKLLTFIKKK